MTRLGTIREHDGREVDVIRFATSDPAALRIGEFVYYMDGDNKVLCRVTGRRNMDAPPSSYFTVTKASPQDMLKFTGAPTTLLKNYVVEAKVIGVKTNLGFEQPRDPAPVGSEMWLAEDDFLEDCINHVPHTKDNDRVRAGAHIGRVRTRDSEVKVVLDVNEILSKHISIISTTGSGKSYTVGVIVEELMMQHNQVPILIFDMHGEYGTLLQAQDRLAVDGYAPEVQILNDDRVKIPFKELSVGDMAFMLPDLTEHMYGALVEAHRNWKHSGNETKKGLSDMIAELGAQNRYHEGTVMGLQNRFDHNILHAKYVEDKQCPNLNELVQPGKTTVLNLANMDDRQQEGVCNALLSLLMKARKQTVTGATNPGDYFHLDHPVLLVVEEAHRLAPAAGNMRTSGTLATVASEGRKFGLGLMVVTQRPSKIDSNILSQCMTQIIGRITNPSDQAQIRESGESATQDLMVMLPSLAKGQVVVFGLGVQTPVLTRVRPRITDHGGGGEAPLDQVARAARNKGASKPAPTFKPPQTSGDGLNF